MLNLNQSKNGFLLFEIMLVITLFSIAIYVTSNLISGLKYRIAWIKAESNLINIWDRLYVQERVIDFYDLTDNGFFYDGYRISRTKKYIDNYAIRMDYIITDNHHSIYRSIFSFSEFGYGQNICNFESSMPLTLAVLNEYEIPDSNSVTGIDVSGEYVFVSTDSNVQSDPDFYMFRINSNTNSFELVSSLNTGPGASSIDVSGDFAFLGNTSINSQLQIFDISNIDAIRQISSYKFTIAGDLAKTVSLFNYNKYLFLGTTKSASSSELYMLDISNPMAVQTVATANLDTQVNSIYSIGDLDNGGLVYIASPTENELRSFRLSADDGTGTQNINLLLVQSLNFNGWQSQEGNTLSQAGDNLYYGRTVGGFNVRNNPEFVSLSTNFSTTTTATSTARNLTVNFAEDIGSSVYGISETRIPNIVSGAPHGQIISGTSTTDLGALGTAFKCINISNPEKSYQIIGTKSPARIMLLEIVDNSKY